VIDFSWDTSTALAGNHVLEAQILPVEGELNLDNNSMASSPGTTLTDASMHILSINMSLASRQVRFTKYTKALASVTIVDSNGLTVSGAVVSGKWSGATNDYDSGTTDSNGRVVFASDELRNPVKKTYTFTVTGVTRTGVLYDPAKNVMDTNSISVK
jgi:hypothetical protein